MNSPHALNRRTFLRRGGGAAAGLGLFHIVPATAVGAGDRPAPSNRVTLAAIGTGGMGTSNMRTFLGNAEVQVVAVCDVDTDHATKAKKLVDDKYKTTDCAVYQDFRELLARGDIDAVCVSTPDHWHALPAIYAARAGIDVYGEKPFAHSVTAGRAMVDTLNRYGRIWQNGSWQRSKAEFRQATELILNGYIGKISRIEVGLPGGKICGPVKFGEPPAGLDYDLWLGPSRWAPYCVERVHYNWRFQLDYGGGKLMDWIPHHGDIAHWSLNQDNGGPEWIEGKGLYSPTGIYDAPYDFWITYGYPGGIEMFVSNKNAMGVKWYGENDQWVYVTRGKIDANPKTLLQETIGPDQIKVYRSLDHHRNFIDGVKTRRPTVTPAETAHRSACIGHLGNIAMRLGRRVRWDAARERFLNDPSADALLGMAYREPWHL